MQEQYYDHIQVADLIRDVYVREPVLEGGREFYAFVSTALSWLPRETLDKVVRNCVYVEITRNKNGIHLTCDDLIKKSVIVIFTDDLMENPKKLIYVILHETAHYILGHRWLRGSSEEIAKEAVSNENAANSLVIKWLTDYGKRFPEKQEGLKELIASVKTVGFQHPASPSEDSGVKGK
jgi:hypothetical protein